MKTKTSHLKGWVNIDEICDSRQCSSRFLAPFLFMNRPPRCKNNLQPQIESREEAVPDF